MAKDFIINAKNFTLTHPTQMKSFPFSRLLVLLDVPVLLYITTTTTAWPTVTLTIEGRVRIVCKFIYYYEHNLFRNIYSIILFGSLFVCLLFPTDFFSLNRCSCFLFVCVCVCAFFRTLAYHVKRMRHNDFHFCRYIR